LPDVPAYKLMVAKAILFKRAHTLVRPMFPQAQANVAAYVVSLVANRLGQVWGIGEDGELANMWKRTPQDGLWFMGGGLAQSRIYSKTVALQIMAIEIGLI